MRRRLLLMRHAKSSWDDPSLSDRDRPLNRRGRRAAAAIGEYLRDHGLVPDAVLCSPAVRARETLDRSGLGPATTIERDELYGADAATLLEAIRSAPPDARTLAVIAHDPGVHDLAVSLAAGASGPDAGSLRDRFPTGAVAAFATDGGWDAVDPRSVRLVAFVRPRDLA
jgi:phosphohistidine phosphatase